MAISLRQVRVAILFAVALLSEAACIDPPELVGRLCNESEPCPTPLVCGHDLKCASPCLSDQECDDGSACTLGASCSDGLCAVTSSITCNIAPGICYVAPGRCDADDGSCVYAPKPEGAPCDDANACTDGDGCANGDCVGGAPRDCDDHNACTDDGCDPASGCTHAANTDACDDGDVCTSGDVCSAEACKPGLPVACDDGNACTSDRCDVALGCVADAVMNGEACTFTGGAPGTCQDGDCAGCVAAADCDDGNPCTQDQCVGGSCLNTPQSAVCDDGDPCTHEDECRAGACTGTSVTCNSNACVTRSCNGTSACTEQVHNNAACADDGDACTRDVCNASGTCTHPYRGDGYQCGANAANRCCSGSCVNISSNRSHCGGCGSACATGLNCESVSVTNTCSRAPSNVSGRCRCQAANSQCPGGQICRTVSPFTNRCTPDAVADCAAGQSIVTLNSCPDYCAY